MGVAFEMALAALRLSDRSDPIIATVAQKIIRFAENGEKNADRLAGSDGSPRDASAAAVDDRDGVQCRRKPAIELDEEKAITVGQLDAAACPALQYDHLLPEGGILGRKLAL
jgi:hypothetical protein